jgi:hypothetical protein
MMVFGQKKLQDEVFCVTQERDFFRSKYLEQVSEIQQMKSDMERSRKEIQRLRQELLDNSLDISDISHEEKSEAQAEQMAQTSLADTIDAGGQQAPPKELRQEPSESEDEGDGDCEEKEEVNDEAADIRQNAAKLLQWANYRTSVTLPKDESATPVTEDEESSVDCE